LKYLLDTNAVSEPQRPLPNPGYMQWIRGQAPQELAMTVLTLGELTRGIAALPAGRRRTDLMEWLAEALTFFGDRILSIDVAVASAWSDVWLAHRRLARQVGVVDELTAAAALAHGLTVVTRNARHFEHSGCKLLSPWSP
jgi:predicted nucleic acid-binding protein